jgi:hypothetical protein
MLCYGLVMVYFNLLILHIIIYVRLITFSDDFSCPKTSVPLGLYYFRIYISDYPCIFSYFPHVQDSDSLCPFPIFSNFLKLPIFFSDVHIPIIRIFSCFSSFRHVLLHANCHLTSVDSTTGAYHPLTTVCLPATDATASAAATIASTAAAASTLLPPPPRPLSTGPLSSSSS